MLNKIPLKKLKTDKGPLAQGASLQGTLSPETRARAEAARLQPGTGSGIPSSTRVWVLSTQVEAQQAEAARAAAELVANETKYESLQRRVRDHEAKKKAWRQEKEKLERQLSEARAREE
jgi:uncharacterized protein YbaP (TraB family)